MRAEVAEEQIPAHGKVGTMDWRRRSSAMKLNAAVDRSPTGRERERMKLPLTAGPRRARRGSQAEERSMSSRRRAPDQAG